MQSATIFVITAFLFALAQVPVAVSTHSSNVCLALESSDQSVVSGRQVEITFTLTNQSRQTIDTSSSWSHSVDDSYEYDVFDQTGKRNARCIHNDFVITRSDMNSTLAPGHASKETLALSDVYDMSVPGTYQAQVSRKVLLNGKEVVVKSNVITITILPKP